MLLVSLAEEYLAAAHQLAPYVAESVNEVQVAEYQRLVALALGCLEATFKRAKPPPRVEAKVRLRYASVLLEETTNYMEAETALVKGLQICENVSDSELRWQALTDASYIIVISNTRCNLSKLN